MVEGGGGEDEEDEEDEEGEGEEISGGDSAVGGQAAAELLRLAENSWAGAGSGGAATPRESAQPSAKQLERSFLCLIGGDNQREGERPSPPKAMVRGEVAAEAEVGTETTEPALASSGLAAEVEALRAASLPVKLSAKAKAAARAAKKAEAAAAAAAEVAAAVGACDLPRGGNPRGARGSAKAKVRREGFGARRK